VFAVMLGLMLGGQIEVLESREFPKAAQEAAVAATVRIVNPAQNAQGTGVIIHQQKPFVYILTANHVVDRADGLEVETFSARSFPKREAVYRSGKVLAQAADEDLAVVRLTTTDPMPGRVRLCSAAQMPRKPGFEALTVGCTDGRPPSCRLEKVTGNKRVRRPSAEAVHVWETNLAPAEGRSGGPLLDRQLQLLGIASGSSEGRGYFTHGEELYRFLRRHGLGWLAQPRKPD
jgi:S1-C subfamily serine protease